VGGREIGKDCGVRSFARRRNRFLPSSLEGRGKSDPPLYARAPKKEGASKAGGG
jgi:hypothetical protein